MAAPLALAALVLGGGAGCKTTPRQAKVEGILVAQADGRLPAEEGQTLVVEKTGEPASLSKDKNVRLAIARDVPWSKVRDLRRTILSADKTPYLLVASGHRVGALELYEELQGDAIDVIVSVGGKLCVSPPNTPEAKCVQRADKVHVDRSFTRELVREAVKAYGLNDVIVDVPADLEWGDLVRAVDGSRTCCFDDKVRVRLKQK